jgi:hypothetical protein
MLESESVAIDVAKPGILSKGTLTLIVEAHGEAKLAVAFNVTMTRTEASSGAVMAANRSIRIDQPSMSAFGLHVEWKLLPPSATWYADLDGSRLKFIDSSRHEFTVKLTCDPGEQSCAADGDEITTIVQLASQQGNGLKSEVRVLTRVQSRVEPDSERVDISTPYCVQVFVNDVDSLRVSFTRAEINLVFAGRTIPMQWSRGSNLYVADVPAQLTSQPGLYDLVLNAGYAWSETGLAPTCELLRRTITVTDHGRR